MTFLIALPSAVRLPLVFALLVVPGVGVTDAETRSDPPSAIEPSRYRGPYVPPAGIGAGSDPFAPGPNSPYWVRLEMTDSEGSNTFPPRVVHVASQLRYEHRNPRLGLGLRIDLDMYPQPFMTVNEKIYPVRIVLSGWPLVARVTADVGSREFERAWFAAFADQTAVLVGLSPSTAVLGASAHFRVEEASFGPLQTTVVHDDGRTTSRAGFAGRLTLRETYGSFVTREWELARQQSFVLAYGVLIGGVATLIGLPVALTRRWMGARRARRSVTAPSPVRPAPRPPSRRTRKRRKRRR